MKGGQFGAGSLHANGTRIYHQPGDSSKAEAGTGKANGKHLPPPLPTWMDDARRKCRDKPTAWWYAPEKDDESGDEVTTKHHAKLAEALCAQCPLNLDCREHGLRHEPNGIWGGVKLPLSTASRRAHLAVVGRERGRDRRRPA